MLDAAGHTPANSTVQFTYICDMLLGLTPGNILLLAFERQGWERTIDLAAVTDGNLNMMTYEAGGLETLVPCGHRAKVCIICSMLAHWTHEK
jgi:hypothetical protein